MNRISVAAIALAVALVSPRAVVAQGTAGADGGGPTLLGLAATRRGLEARAERLEQTALSTSQSTTTRADAAREAADIRHRLAEGDFRVGDRVVMVVEGEPTLSDTFTVGPGIGLTLPAIGEISLGGVLRSELQPYLTRRLGENLRDPVVRAHAYIRLSIIGAVARPGYYGVPADALLSDALMAAGGPTADAKLEKLRIERDGRRIWEGKQLQQAIAQGRTIDDAGLMAGDQYVVPGKGRTSTGDVLRFGAFVLTIPVTVYTLTKLF
jgi:protein involved in polysaccharide export with SLBB domain